MDSEKFDLREQELLQTAERMASGGRTAVMASKAALIVDLSGIPETSDPVFLRTLLRFIEQRSAGIKHDSYLLGGYRFAVLASGEEARKFIDVIHELSAHLLKHDHGAIQTQVFDLVDHADRFLAKCHELIARKQGSLPPEPSHKLNGSLDDIEKLISIERALRNADISSLLRQQGIWRFDAENEPEFLRSEVWTSIKSLEGLLGIELHANPWLFQHATEILDHRLLRYLIRSQSELRVGHSINLHSSSLMTADFDEFTNMISPAVRHGFMIELQSLEFEGEPAHLRQMVEMLKTRGFQVALDNVTWARFATLDPPKEIDWIKVPVWPELSALEGDGLKQVTEAIARVGVDRSVLFRLDGLQQITSGLKAGFRLMQGFIVDGTARDAGQANNVLVLAGLREEEAAEEETEE